MAYTEQQLKDAARKALAAGDAPAAKRYIDAARAAAAQAQPLRQAAGTPTAGYNPPERTLGQTIYENVIGSGAVDTPGERAGELIRGAAPALTRGAMELIGLPGTLSSLMDVGAKKIGLLREDAPPSPVFSALSGEGLGRAASAVTGGETEYVAPGRAGQFISTGLEFMGGGLGGTARNVAMAGLSGLASEAAGQATEGTAIEPYARLTGALAGGLAFQGVSGLVDATRRNKAIRQFMDETPDVAALKSQAGDLYNAARAQGAVATPAQVNTIGDDLMQTLRGEGLITPKGNMAGSYPRVSDAIKLVDDYRGAPMTPTEMLQVRKSFQAAAQSADPVEARIGTILIRQFDDFTSPLAPQIAEANQIYRRAMQGDLIETTIELAGSRSGQFSGSGFENALRTEFRGLERKIIKGQLKVTPDEEALIKRIAQGGFAENLSRDIGKAAPRGVVSSGLAGGVPFAIGTSIGGPALGAALGAGTLAAGEVGRRIATSLQGRNAGLLSALARSGGQLPANIGTVTSVPSMIGTIPGLLAQ